MSFEHVLLCIRGTLAAGNDREVSRETHNRTAGDPEGVKLARSMGDLSHKVFVSSGGKNNGALDDELLILDVWQTPEAIQKFFSNAAVQGGGAKLFKSRDPGVFMPAKGAPTFTIVAPMNKPERHVAMLRGKVKSPEACIESFKKHQAQFINAARQRGQLSHELYVRLDGPGKDGLIEVLAVDTWCDPGGMAAHYSEVMGGLAPVFAEPPVTSVWTQPPGAWVEW